MSTFLCSEVAYFKNRVSNSTMIVLGIIFKNQISKIDYK